MQFFLYFHNTQASISVKGLDPFKQDLHVMFTMRKESMSSTAAPTTNVSMHLALSDVLDGCHPRV